MGGWAGATAEALPCWQAGALGLVCCRCEEREGNNLPARPPILRVGHLPGPLTQLAISQPFALPRKAGTPETGTTATRSTVTATIQSCRMPSFMEKPCSRAGGGVAAVTLQGRPQADAPAPPRPTARYPR